MKIWNCKLERHELIKTKFGAFVNCFQTNSMHMVYSLFIRKFAVSEKYWSSNSNDGQ